MLDAAAGIIISVLFQRAVFISTSQVYSWFVGLAEPIRVEIREASLRTEDHRAAWARARVFADQQVYRWKRRSDSTAERVCKRQSPSDLEGLSELNNLA